MSVKLYNLLANNEITSLLRNKFTRLFLLNQANKSPKHKGNYCESSEKVSEVSNYWRTKARQDQFGTWLTPWLVFTSLKKKTHY